MLVLVSFGLVLLATILLVVGLLNDDGLTLIYLSIGASATAAVVLYIAFRMARPKKDVDAASAPAPLADDIAPKPIDDTAVVATVAAPEPEPAAESEPEVAVGDDEWMADADWEQDEVVDFPIADYDDLTVAEIMPLLPQLYSDELDDVIERERAGKNRTTVLTRLDELKEIGTDADAAEQEAAAAVADPEPTPAAESRSGSSVAESMADEDADDGYLVPIADYDDLSVSQITPLLAQLENDELEEVRAREIIGAGRKTILAEIDRQVGGAGEPTARPPAKKAPAKKAPAKKQASPASRAKNAPAKKKAPAKKQASAKKTAKKARKAAKKAAPRFPIAGYDELTVADIRPRLTDLSDGQLELVRDREASGAGRKTILKDIENRLG